MDRIQSTPTILFQLLGDFISLLFLVVETFTAGYWFFVISYWKLCYLKELFAWTFRLFFWYLEWLLFMNSNPEQDTRITSFSSFFGIVPLNVITFHSAPQCLPEFWIDCDKILPFSTLCHDISFRFHLLVSLCWNSDGILNTLRKLTSTWWYLFLKKNYLILIPIRQSPLYSILLQFNAYFTFQNIFICNWFIVSFLLFYLSVVCGNYHSFIFFCLTFPVSTLV